MRAHAEKLLPFAELTGAAGILLYAVGRYSTETFLDRYGISPEEVGLTPTSLIWPVAVSAFLFAGTLVACSSISKRLVGPKGSRRWLIIIPPAALAYVLLVRTSSEAPGTAKHAFLWCVWYGIQWGALTGLLARSPQQGRAGVVRQQMLRLFAFAYLIIPFVNSTIIPWTDYPKTMSKQIENGQEAEFSGTAAQSTKFQLVWVAPGSQTGTPRHLSDRCLHYFGSAAGVAVLYDRRDRTVWRLPAEDLILRHPCYGECATTEGRRLNAIRSVVSDAGRYQFDRTREVALGEWSDQGDAHTRYIVGAVIDDRDELAVEKKFFFSSWIVHEKNGTVTSIEGYHGAERKISRTPAAKDLVEGADSVTACLFTVRKGR